MSVTAYAADGVTKLVDHKPVEGSFNGMYTAYGFTLKGLPPIKRLVVHAPVPLPPDQAPGRAISIIMDIGLLCPPTNDPVLDDPAVRQQLLDQLARSRPNADGTGKKEYGGYVYQHDDGTYFLYPANDLTATDCGFTIPAGSPPVVAGAHYAGRFWHTHPSHEGDRLYGCSWAKPGDIVRATRDPKYGGGSPQDWDSVNEVHTPGYIIDLDKNVYRLDPDRPENQRGSNPNHWKYDPSGLCLLFA
jgi:hypothetical protein